MLAGCTRFAWPDVDLSRLPPEQADALKAAITGVDPQACRAAIAAVGVRATLVPDQRDDRGCGFDDALRVTRTTLALSGPFIAECPVVAALAAWEIGVVAPAAQTRFGTTPARLNHVGTYACRTVNRRPGARLSQHALGKAIDVAGVTLADGRDVRVSAANWADDGATGGFLKDLRDGACGAFRSVIGPARDRAHANHFHLDLGPFRVCR